MKSYLMHQLGLEAPKLPFMTGALEPILSARSVELHYGQHRKYCENTRRLVDELDGDSGLSTRSRLQDVVRWAAMHTDTPGPNDLFSQAAQAWNHAFLWLSMRPRRSSLGTDPAELENPKEYAATHFAECARNAGFNSLTAIKAEIIETAINSFGSGWVWLILDGDGLAVRLSENAGTYLETSAGTPLLVVDLWEHASFIDFQFDRAGYVRSVVENLLDWDHAAERVALHELGEDQ